MSVSDRLNSQQRRSLNKSIQAALNSSAVSLGQMLGGTINIGLVQAPLQNEGLCLHLGLTGVLEGGIYLYIPEAMSLTIVKTLVPQKELSLLDSTAQSGLMEFGNILASVFVAYFDQHRGLRTMPTPPKLSLTSFVRASFAETLVAEISWSKSQERAKVLICLERSALDILLAD